MLNRVLVNLSWFSNFPNSTAFSLPSLSSDHSPLLVNQNNNTSMNGFRPFKYCNYWCQYEDYFFTI